MPRHSPIRLFLLVSMLLGLGVMPSPAPALEVILMRHADKDPQRGDYNLSPEGFQRAMRIARLIPACFGLPTAITTYFLDPQTSKNARSYQSAVPLAVATGVNIQIALDASAASEQIGRRLRQGRPSARQVVFWEHRRMPDLARGLGWSEMAPIAETDFDELFVFRYADASAPPEVRVYRQSELVQSPCFRTAHLPWEQITPAAPSSRQP